MVWNQHHLPQLQSGKTISKEPLLTSWLVSKEDLYPPRCGLTLDDIDTCIFKMQFVDVPQMLQIGHICGVNAGALAHTNTLAALLVEPFVVRTFRCIRHLNKAFAWRATLWQWPPKPQCLHLGPALHADLQGSIRVGAGLSPPSTY